MANSVAPTAKSDLNSIEPWAVSPMLIWAMKPVIVCTLSRGSNVNCGFVPPAMSDGHRLADGAAQGQDDGAMIPESAAGNTTLRIVSNRVAPIA